MKSDRPNSKEQAHNQNVDSGCGDSVEEMLECLEPSQHVLEPSKKPLDRSLLGLKTSKLEPYMKQINSAKNLDLMQTIGRQILDRAEQMKGILVRESVDKPSRGVIAQAGRMTKQTISKVFPVSTQSKDPRADKTAVKED